MRLTVRIPDEFYDRLEPELKKNGYGSFSDLLIDMLRRYIKEPLRQNDAVKEITPPSQYTSKAEFFRNKEAQLQEKLQEKPEFPKTMDQPASPIESVKELWGTQPIPCRICHSTPTVNWRVEYDGTVDYVPLCKTHYEEQVRKGEKPDYTGIRVSGRVAGENVYFHPIPKPKKKK